MGNPNDGVTTSINATTGLSTQTSTGDFDEQSGYLLRLDGLLLKDLDYNLHVGVNVSGILQPADTTAPGAAAVLPLRFLRQGSWPWPLQETTRFASAQTAWEVGDLLPGDYLVFLGTHQLDPITVPSSGFTVLLFTMAVIASLTLLAVSFLPAHDPEPVPA